MAVGFDGHGWIGHDKDGRTIYKSDEDLRRESRQRQADAARPETLYVCDKYQLFFLTRQPGTTGDGRLAYIAARPFSTLGPAAREELNEKAEPWHEDASRIQIGRGENHLAFYDDITGTTSAFDLSLMDPKAYRDHFNQSAAAGVWANYTATPIPPKPLRLSFKL